MQEEHTDDKFLFHAQRAIMINCSCVDGNHYQPSKYVKRESYMCRDDVAVDLLF